jgi:heme oxygenase
MKRIKEWFREGMNAAGKSDDVKAAVVVEAALAFELNAGLLTILDAEAPLEDVKEPVEIVLEAPSVESTYSISSVLAVITAVCLAHFIIVVGGFSGTKGYEKLQAAEQWVRNYWRPISE